MALLKQNLRRAKDGWSHHPAAMISDIIVSGLIGQGVFWLVGYDQIGLSMRPQREFGIGRRVVRRLMPFVPTSPRAAWALKGVEITTDALRGWAEGEVYYRHGITPDALATACPAPLWQSIEAAEKVVGAIRHPERVTEPASVELSLACIYGSLVRYAMAFCYLRYGDDIHRLIGRPIGRQMQRLTA